MLRTSFIFAVLVTAGAAQATFQVPADHTSIQAAIVAAASGDTIEVAPGVYHEHDISFLGKNLTVIGSGGPAQTIVDALQQGRCFLFTQGESAAARLEGLTLFQGVAPDGTTGGANGGHGGGILMQNASPTISRCIFYACRSGVGGTSVLDPLSPAPGGNGGSGGGVACFNSSPRFESCAFVRCVASAGGEGVSCSPLLTTTCNFPGGAGGFGGGVFAGPVSNPLILGCTFFDNQVGGPTFGSTNGEHGHGVCVAGSATVVGSIAWKHTIGPFVGINSPNFPQATTEAFFGSVAVITCLVNLDPHFVDPDPPVGLPDIRPTALSPIVDLGAPLMDAGDLDLLGRPREIYLTWDAGCCEYVSPAASGTVRDSSGQRFRPLAVDGDTSLIVSRPLSQPFTIRMSQPPARSVPARFALFLQMGNLSIFDEMESPLGPLAFTPKILQPADPLLFTVTDNFGAAPAPLFPSAPGTWTLAVPGFSTPFRFAIQGVIEQNDSPFPLNLGITNVIDVRLGF